MFTRQRFPTRRGRVRQLRFGVFLVGFLAWGSSVGWSQPTVTTDRVAALQSALAHRIIYLGSTESIDPCSVYKAIGDSTLIARLVDPVRKNLTPRIGGPCGLLPANGFPERYLQADSIVQRGPNSWEVYLIVFVSSNFHRERIAVYQSSDSWGVSEILINTFGTFERARARVIGIPPRQDTSKVERRVPR